MNGGIDVQTDRLLDGLRPGQDKERFAGWGREMRLLYAGVDAQVLRAAVTRYLVCERNVPTPAEFGAWIDLARRSLERERRERLAKLAPPPEPDEEERRQAEARIQAEKQAAREYLRERRVIR